MGSFPHLLFSIFSILCSGLARVLGLSKHWLLLKPRGTFDFFWNIGSNIMPTISFANYFRIIGALLASNTLVQAAPPNVTGLFPSGGQRGTTCEVTAQGSFDHWPVKVWASSHGVSVIAAQTKGQFKVTIAADAVPGVYWLRMHNDQGASGLRPFIVGSLPEVMEKEPNDDAQSAQRIEGNAIANGRLAKAGDVDCYAVSLKKGQTLVAALDAYEVLRSPIDAILQITSADGFVLGVNHDFHGLDPLIAFVAPKDGTYLVRVFAFPSTPNSTIRFTGADSDLYRLTLTTGGFADFSVPLAVERGKTASVMVAGWNIPDSARSLPVPATRDETFTLAHPAIANSLTLRIEPHACFELFPKKPAEKPFTPPFSITGRLAASGDQAAISFNGKKGESLSIQVQSQQLGVAVHPVIRVLSNKQVQLARAEPSKPTTDSTLIFKTPADGDYTIVVSDLLTHGGPRHAFLLRVVPVIPQFDLKVATDRFAVPPGKSVDIPVKIDRLNGLKQPVEIAVHGLPNGVNWQVKAPTGKVDPNTTTVTLTGTKADIAGSFRIVGRLKGEPQFTHTARAPLPEFDSSTTELWVNVSDSPAVGAPPKKKKK